MVALRKMTLRFSASEHLKKGIGYLGNFGDLQMRWFWMNSIVDVTT